MKKSLNAGLLTISLIAAVIFSSKSISLAQELPQFTFDELISLSASLDQPQQLLDKVDQTLHYPFVDNSIRQSEYFQPKKNDRIGSYVRVASWNIARGMNIDNIKQVFSNSDGLVNNVNEKIKKAPQCLEKLKEQITILKNSDFIFLNEVDLGMPRTDYRDIAKELAQTLKYNYAYGVEFMEIDPSYLGIGENKWSENKALEKNGQIKKPLEVDKAKYKGFHGSAILSRFPLQNVRIIRLPMAYNWYSHEKERITTLEEARRHVAEGVFKEYMLTEIRIGSRMALIADVNIPGFDQKVTLVCTHIENRTEPKNRAAQIKYLLEQLKNVDNPIVFAGDFNTTMADGSSVSVQNEFLKRIKDPHFIGKTALLYGNPYGLAISATSEVYNFVRLTNNPAAHSIPLFAPNQERATFNVIKDFEFDDKNNFDMRGNKDKSINNNTGFLANSNEKTFKGFTPTFIFKKDYGLLKYKLDWIFVKAYAKNADDKDESYKFAPHFGRTLYDLNYDFDVPLSDHAPITVDLPLTEYNKEIKGKTDKKKVVKGIHE
jgi:endonuclease/exonuclease/phosphatase family metal-dependent hydrolase